MGVPPGAISFVVNPYLTGSKIAFRTGTGPVHISPAMHALMRGASPEELERLLASIKILTLPPPLSMYSSR